MERQEIQTADAETIRDWYNFRNDKDLSRFLLARLTRAVRLFRDNKDALNDQGIFLMRRAIFAIYLDCIAVDLKSQATNLVANSRPQN